MHSLKKSYLILYYTLLTAFAVALTNYIYLNSGSEKIINSLPIMIAVVISLIIMNYSYRREKCIQFFGNYLRINAYHHKYTVFISKNYNILYEDIWYIKVKKVPVLGVIAVVINAKNQEKRFVLYRYYKKFGQMCETLYDKTKSFSPNAKFDKEFLDFLKRKNRL